jgi:hypothetical protein
MNIGHHYRIQPHKKSHMRYVLSGGGKDLSTLTLHNRHGSRGVIINGEQTILVSRSATFKKHLLIENMKGSATFTADSLSRGSLMIGDVTYHWAPKNLHWTEWAWHNEHGHEVLGIRSKESLVEHRGDVRAKHPVLSDLEKELALLGWYLILLNQQHFGMHLLTAIDLRLMNKTSVR